MHDIKFIRENPEVFDKGLEKRGLAPQSANFLKLDEEKRAKQTELQELLAQRNQFAKAIGQAKAKGEDVSTIMAESKNVNERIASLEKSVNEEDALTAALASLPNLPAADVPVGKDEHDNVQIREHGSKPVFSFTPKEHFDLGEKLGMMDFERAAKISGARFVALKGPLARLERALANFMLDIHTKDFGFTEVVPPMLVKDNAVFGTGQLPKFSEDLFKTTTGHWLIPTSEVSLTNLVADEILAETELPMRLTAYTPCFRSEAGSAGKDTRGMIRQHQFTKVEMVCIAHPDQSDAEHERMTAGAEEVLKRLGLHYRVMQLCTGDMGFSSRKTYDIEVWLPGQNAYREISSISNCGDFQARRMKARFRVKDAKGTQFVHTLNGSGLAIGRTMVAILENYQQEDGSIRVPDALRPYMGGLEVIK
ncbi:MAG TPA: serine--tRNA ligase [Rickettsiales bacterium]|nr:serine--tRNA ligase [Rickettsiales bacterium]